MGWTAPKTWVVGETLRAADFNTYLRDNSSYANDGNTAAAAGPSDVAWAPFGTAFVPYPLFRRVGNLVHFQCVQEGRLPPASPPPAPPTPIAYVPAGYVPAYRQILTVVTVNGIGRVDITTASDPSPGAVLLISPAVGAGGFVGVCGVYSLV